MFSLVLTHSKKFSYSICIKTIFYYIQSKYLFGVANEAWWNEQGNKKWILHAINKKNSPGHNTKHLRYSFLDQSSNKIAGLVVIQCTTAGNLDRMEKNAFEKLLGEIQNNKKIFPKLQQIVMPKSKSAWQKITKILITSLIYGMYVKKSCFIMNGWIKSVWNHFWWCCRSCDGDEQLLKEKWVSILFHIQNKHGHLLCYL